MLGDRSPSTCSALARPRSSSASGRSRRAIRRTSSRLPRAVSCASSDAAQPRLGHVAGHAAELQHDAGERLADAVVELLRDAQPLALLGGQRAADAVAPLGLEAVEHVVERGGELRGLRVAAARPRAGGPARAGRSCARTRSARAAARARARSSSRLTPSISARPPAKIANSRSGDARDTAGEKTSAVIVQAAASTAALPMATRQNSAGPRERANTDVDCGTQRSRAPPARQPKRARGGLAAGTPPVIRLTMPVGPTSMSHSEE